MFLVIIFTALHNFVLLIMLEHHSFFIHLIGNCSDMRQEPADSALLPAHAWSSHNEDAGGCGQGRCVGMLLQCAELAPTLFLCAVTDDADHKDFPAGKEGHFHSLFN